ncbi:MAG: hypothetical protein K8W52_21885 [Deltaproteobacteria bacterium]|nr:hypothetical protein [Deltaproteobacteria bacterium]
MRIRLSCLAAILTFAACGGGNDVTPTLIPGGGVGSGDIDGEVNVYVIDDDTDAPITGAKVRVGSIEGTTDATGLFTASGDAVSGKQTIAAVASGHVAALWVGVNGANVTIPVGVSGTTTPTIPQAELDGTIVGWDQLATPAQNHATAGLTTYTSTPDFGGDENSLAPPSVAGNVPANVCIKAQIGSAPCAWRINARTGRVAVFTTLFDIDTKGTLTDQTDDTRTLTGYAFKTGVTVANGAKQTGLDTTQVAAGDTETGAIAFGTPPASLTDVQGIIGFDLGTDGIAMLPNPLTPAAASMIVPKTSAFPGSTYRATVLAKRTTGSAQSLVFKRGLSSATSIAVGDWLTSPTGITAAGDVMSFTAVAGAQLHSIDVSNASGRLWNISLFDGSVSATVPTDLAPIPSGSITVAVNAIDTQLDLGDFTLDDLGNIVDRLSTDQVTATH